MKKKTLLFSLLALGVLTVVGIQTVSARGLFMGGRNIDPDTLAQNQQDMFEHQAELLGITVDQVKIYWAQGKNVQEIATELGISQEQLQEKMAAERQAVMKANLQTLVDKGIITQAQADSRLQFMTENAASGKFGRHMGMGDGIKGGYDRGQGAQSNNQ